ncbi:MAG: DUF2953 domain-containing protein [Clostridia bacterium]|nr:DUF2953 domain-containing protein [Clostridia bacterium]
MAIVFFIILFLILCILLITFSTIKINIQKLNFNNEEVNSALDYSFFIELYFLDKIKIFSLMINPEKLEKLNKKMNLETKIKQVNFSKIKNELPNKNEIKELVKKLKIKLDEFHLILQIGTEDVIITSAIVTGIASILGIILAKLIKNYNDEKYRYEIMPVYKNKNMVKLSFDCIIKVKMIHIINIIYTLVSKRKEKIKYERTSNRRSYDYSYE